MELFIDGLEREDEALLEKMEAIVSLCLKAHNLSPENTQVSVTFVDGEEIKNLNSQYRGIDKVTDVLSFPQFEDMEEARNLEEVILGDVVICKEKIEEQAEDFGHSYERELLYLFTHSILHLLGYDHLEEDEKKEMRRMEEEIMEKIDMGRAEESYEEEEISDESLYMIARKVAERAYAPFSNFKVGAALLSKGEEGIVFTGVNVENSSLGATICAERTACVKAVSEGIMEFSKIAVATTEGEAFPCGICRQFLYEFAPDLEVITGPDVNHLKKYKLNEMLIEGFRLR